MSDVTDLKAEVLLLNKENAELRAQNARLRELVSFALDCIAKGGCNLCRVHNGFCMLEDSCRDLVTEV